MTMSFSGGAGVGFGSESPATGVAVFELAAGPLAGRDLEVVSFRGREKISRLFWFDILIVTRLDSEIVESTLGQPAVLSIRSSEGASRAVRGIVASVAPEATSTPDGRHAYRFRIVPRLWLLKHRITSRIFQNQDVPAIIEAVLEAAGVPGRVAVSRSYPARAYCVQYKESDYDFIRRLLAEEGIFYFFDFLSGFFGPSGPGDAAAEVVVFADDPAAYPPIAGSAGEPAPSATPGVNVPSPHLHLRQVKGIASAEHDVHHFVLRRSVRPGAVLLRDYDFRKPLLDLRSDAAGRNQGPANQADLQVYEHRGDYEEPEVNPSRAEVVLEQYRRRALAGEGESSARNLVAGHRFHLDAESAPRLSGEYVLTCVEHAGHAPEYTGAGQSPKDGRLQVYSNRFACLPADVAARPKRPKPKLRQILESATVVGPPGEEIHTDEYGRIRVQFHWDLQGQKNENSSCWIRVVQTWAGAAWGMQFIPRVGMEVMVSFLGGDQDCPIIVGCVYNATHPTPFQLPGDKARSGIRTQSTPGGGGFNELSFDDRAGDECILLHAARDLEESVTHDHRVTVSGEQTISVTGSRADTVMGAQTRVTMGDLREVALGSRIDQVGGARREEIGGGRSVTVYGLAATTVKGDAVKTVEGEANLRVHGSLTTEIGKDDDRRSLEAFVWGDGVLSASDSLHLRGDARIVLASGESRIELTPKGIVLHAPQITIAGTETVSLRGDGPALRFEKKDVELTANAVRLYATQSSLELDDDARLDGRTVKLNCGPLDPDENVDENGKPTVQHLRLRLTDVAMKPYANKDYVLRAHGMRIDGKTDPDGVIEADLPGEAKTAEITLWIEPRPTGKTKRYVVNLGELAPPETVAGVEVRLRNLGYYWGASQSEIAGDLAGALRNFQQDHGLEPTGRLDAPTRSKLVEIYGH